MQGFRDLGNRRASPQDAKGAASISAAFQTGSTGRKSSQRLDDLRANFHKCVEDLVVCIAELRADGIANALDCAADSGL